MAKVWKQSVLINSWRKLLKLNQEVNIDTDNMDESGRQGTK